MSFLENYSQTDGPVPGILPQKKSEKHRINRIRLENQMIGNKNLVLDKTIWLTTCMLFPTLCGGCTLANVLV